MIMEHWQTYVYGGNRWSIRYGHMVRMKRTGTSLTASIELWSDFLRMRGNSAF
jgi:hypothetical protein